MAINKQRKPKRWELYKKEYQVPELRTDEPVGLYPRQSTKKQLKKNRQSFEKQTQDNVNDLIKRGWNQELIHIYDKDMGTSAVRAMEERALDEMLSDVREKRIRTVRASEVDRLFRDEDQIDSNVFIKVCKEADCLVITDRMTYDFSIPRHVDSFRDEVERAWKFYEYQILIKAGEHQDRARSQGLYAGNTIPIGFIVDKNPKSPHYLRYVGYPRHSERTRELFQWFYDCGGIFGLLWQKVCMLPYVWPIEEEWVRNQKAFTTNLEVVYSVECDEEGNHIPIGYNISADGLRKLLKNRTYGGDMPYNGDWIENNHEAIVPKDLLTFAYDHLTREPSPNGEEKQQNYYKETCSVVHNLLQAGPEGSKNRYILFRHAEQRYVILEMQRVKQRVYLATVPLDQIEKPFIEKFTERLRDAKRFEGYEKHAVNEDDEKKAQERKKNLQSILQELNERIDGIFLTLQSSKLEPSDRNDFLEERHRLIRRKEALQNELKIKSPAQVYLKYKDLIEKMGKYWDKFPFEDRLTLVTLLVSKIYIEPLSHQFLKITIVWKAFPKDEGILWRSKPSGINWEPEEDEILRQLYPTGTFEEVMRALPRRSWQGIRTWANDMSVQVKRRVKTKLTMPVHLSIEDLQVMERYGISEEMLGETLSTTWVWGR